MEIFRSSRTLSVSVSIWRRDSRRESREKSYRRFTADRTQNPVSIFLRYSRHSRSWLNARDSILILACSGEEARHKPPKCPSYRVSINKRGTGIGSIGLRVRNGSSEFSRRVILSYGTNLGRFVPTRSDSPGAVRPRHKGRRYSDRARSIVREATAPF